jgi:hypothetical protein
VSRRTRYERVLDNIWHLERALGWEPTVRAPQRGRTPTAKEAAEKWSAGAAAKAANYSTGVSSYHSLFALSQESSTPTGTVGGTSSRTTA